MELSFSQVLIQMWGWGEICSFCLNFPLPSLWLLFSFPPPVHPLSSLTNTVLLQLRKLKSYFNSLEGTTEGFKTALIQVLEPEDHCGATDIHSGRGHF